MPHGLSQDGRTALVAEAVNNRQLRVCLPRVVFSLQNWTFLFHQLLFWPKPPPPSMLDVFFRAPLMLTSNLGSLWLLSALHCQAKSTPSSADSHPQCCEEVSIVPISGFNFSGASSLDHIVAGLLDLNAHLSRPSFVTEWAFCNTGQGSPLCSQTLMSNAVQFSPAPASFFLPGAPPASACLPTAKFCLCSAFVLELSFSTNRPSTSSPFSAKKPSQLSADHRALPWRQRLWNLLTYLLGEIPHGRCHFSPWQEKDLF